jgi:FkbM family methyltransferase
MSLYKEKLSYKNGIYIELGAFDGIHWSNTKWLEDDYDWRGILIEPSFVGYESCLKHRQNNQIFNCACVSFDYTDKSIMGDFNGHPMSSINSTRLSGSSEIEVSARTLQSIIDESNYENIDFLSLDVEGYEFDVLKGIDFNKQKINYMLIEVYNKDKDNIFNYLKSKNYDMIENVTDFAKQGGNWDGTHDDYFFELKK